MARALAQRARAPEAHGRQQRAKRPRRVGDRTRTVASPYRVVCGRLRRCGRVRVRGDRGGEPVPITAAAGVQIRARRASPGGRGGQENSYVRPNNKEGHFGTSKEKLTG